MTARLEDNTGRGAGAAAVVLCALALAGCGRSSTQSAGDAKPVQAAATGGTAWTAAPATASGAQPKAADANADPGEGPGPSSAARNSLAPAERAGECRHCGVILQIAAVGKDGKPTEFQSGAVNADVGYYNVTVKLDSGPSMVVRLRQPPELPAGAAVNVTNGELIAR